MRTKIEEYILKNRDEIIDSLKALVEIPSIVENGDEEYPCGKNVADALNKVAELYTENGFDMSVKHKDCYALFETNKANKSIGLFAHADVVPVNDDWIYTKPFEPKEINGKLFGRGIEDNKSGVIGTLFALKALRECGYSLKNDITVFIGGCEEIGMADIDNFTAKEKIPTVSLVPDSEFPVSCGEKGIVRMECVSRNCFENIKVFKGGMAFNVVLDKVEVQIGHSDELFKQVKAKAAAAVSDGEIIKFTVHGIPKHAAMPEGSENAAYKAAEILTGIDALSENDKKILECVRDVCEKYYGETLGIAKKDAFDELTCANGIVDIKDGKMYFTLDIRYGNESDGNTILNNVKTALEKYDFEVLSFEDMPGFLLDENSDVTKAIIETYREFTGENDAHPYKSKGGTYARHISNAYAIGTTLKEGKSGLDMPAGHGNIHESDECLDIDGFLSAIALIAITIHKIDCVL